ncbi:MAG: 16S rRNA (adenine(1518)-N(6)/adenine(1519)-N(6))-dimethyltransferase RsmA [Coriobacteriales bacterium]|nr:16S rRNA (adenine(1518)-N(6)/adenine(1519)-N(6))-dimethyltransferase RsmA [Coriobacteriales bacterium]
MAISKLANINSIKSTLESQGLRAKYSLGQNFLIDDNIIRQMIELSGSDCAQLDCILEVGPGIGTLTCALLKYANVVAIEKDPDMCTILNQTCSDSTFNLHLLNQDALKLKSLDLSYFCDKKGIVVPNVLVANLPYNIAATLLLDYFQNLASLESATVMVQKEVGQRIKAQIGTKDYGAYSLKLSLYASVKSSFNVSRNCFYPAPRVDSSVVRLDKNYKYAQIDSNARLEICKLIDCAFAMRRKNIKNNLSVKYAIDALDKAFLSCNINPTQRAETLKLDDFVNLYSVLN